MTATTLNASQIATYAYRAGFRGNALVTAVAVALAESSGRTWVVNSLGCVGLWQVRQSAHPQWTTAQLQDPATNAAAAFSISSGGTNWQPWTTYTSGVYAAQLPAARLGAAAVNTTSTTATDASSVTDLGVSALDPLSGIGGVASAIGSLSTLGISVAAWVSDPHNWLRVVEVIGGGVAIVIGLRMLADSGVPSPVVSAVKGVETAGAGAKSAAKSTAKTAAEIGAVAL